MLCDTGTALPCAGKGDHPNELDLAEVQIQVNQESKETFDFDQGTRKYGHIKFSQSIGLPPRNSYLVAIQELAARACLLVFCKLLQTFLQTQSLPSRNSQPCVFRRLYKIQCIPKLPEPWFKFKNFETKAMRRSCTSSRCIWFSWSPFPAQGSAVSSLLNPMYQSHGNLYPQRVTCAH